MVIQPMVATWRRSSDGKHEEEHRELHYMLPADHRKGPEEQWCGSDPAAGRTILTHSWWDTVDWIASWWDSLSAVPGSDCSGDRTLDCFGFVLAAAGSDHLPVALQRQGRIRIACFGTSGRWPGQGILSPESGGWALRQHAKTDPALVAAFVSRETLPALTVREARKQLVKEGY